MTNGPYAAALARFTYKPEVRLSCVARDDGDHELCLATIGANSRHPEQTRLFTASRVIRADLEPEQFRDELVGLIRWWEEHEAYEWMRWDRSLVLEPHTAEGAAIGQQDRFRPVFVDPLR